MAETTQNPIVGQEYRFLEDGFMCKDWSGPIRYEDVVSAANVPEGSACFDVSFLTAKGKKRKLSIILDSHTQSEPLRGLLSRKMPGVSAHTRPQTAWETCGTWVTAGLCLAGLVVLIIVLNTWGQGATVSVPIWLIPVLMIGSFLSTEVLLIIAAAILVIFGAGAALSLRKRKTVWEITR